MTSFLQEALREERTRREELEMLLDEQYKRTDVSRIFCFLISIS